MRFKQLLSFLIWVSAVTSLGAQATWNGSVSSDWNDAANWTPSVVPTAASNVTITGGGQVCEITVTNAVARTIVVSGNTSFRVGSGGVLTLNATAGTAINKLTVQASGNFTLASGGVVNIAGLNPGNGVLNNGIANIEGDMSVNAGTAFANNASGTLTFYFSSNVTVTNTGGATLNTGISNSGYTNIAGQFTITNPSVRGISNLTGATFITDTPSATLTINHGISGARAIYTQGTFTSFGQINILPNGLSATTAFSFETGGGTFTNNDTLNIGNSSFILAGMLVGGGTTVTNNGYMAFQNTDDQSLLNNGIFTNEANAVLKINTTSSAPRSITSENSASGYLVNAFCGRIYINKGLFLYSSSNFTKNFGYIESDYSGSFPFNTVGFENDGAIAVIGSFGAMAAGSSGYFLDRVANNDVNGPPSTSTYGPTIVSSDPSLTNYPVFDVISATGFVTLGTFTWVSSSDNYLTFNGGAVNPGAQQALVRVFTSGCFVNPEIPVSFNVLPGAGQVLWTGAVNNVWTNNANWSGIASGYPGDAVNSNLDVYVNGGSYTNFPSLSAIMSSNLNSLVLEDTAQMFISALGHLKTTNSGGFAVNINSESKLTIASGGILSVEPNSAEGILLNDGELDNRGTINVRDLSSFDSNKAISLLARSYMLNRNTINISGNNSVGIYVQNAKFTNLKIGATRPVINISGSTSRFIEVQASYGIGDSSLFRNGGNIFITGNVQSSAGVYMYGKSTFFENGKNNSTNSFLNDYGLLSIIGSRNGIKAIGDYNGVPRIGNYPTNASASTINISNLDVETNSFDINEGFVLDGGAILSNDAGCTISITQAAACTDMIGMSVKNLSAVNNSGTIDIVANAGFPMDYGFKGLNIDYTGTSTASLNVTCSQNSDMIGIQVDRGLVNTRPTLFWADGGELNVLNGALGLCVGEGYTASLTNGADVVITDIQGSSTYGGVGLCVKGELNNESSSSVLISGVDGDGVKNEGDIYNETFASLIVEDVTRIGIQGMNGSYFENATGSAGVSITNAVDNGLLLEQTTAGAPSLLFSNFSSLYISTVTNGFGGRGIELVSGAKFLNNIGGNILIDNCETGAYINDAVFTNNQGSVNIHNSQNKGIDISAYIYTNMTGIDAGFYNEIGVVSITNTSPCNTGIYVRGGYDGFSNAAYYTNGFNGAALVANTYVQGAEKGIHVDVFGHFDNVRSGSTFENGVFVRDLVSTGGNLTGILTSSNPGNSGKGIIYSYGQLEIIQNLATTDDFIGIDNEGELYLNDFSVNYSGQFMGHLLINGNGVANSASSKGIFNQGFIECYNTNITITNVSGGISNENNVANSFSSPVINLYSVFAELRNGKNIPGTNGVSNQGDFMLGNGSELTIADMGTGDAFNQDYTNMNLSSPVFNCYGTLNISSPTLGAQRGIAIQDGYCQNYYSGQINVNDVNIGLEVSDSSIFINAESAKLALSKPIAANYASSFGIRHNSNRPLENYGGILIDGFETGLRNASGSTVTNGYSPALSGNAKIGITNPTANRSIDNDGVINNNCRDMIDVDNRIVNQGTINNNGGFVNRDAGTPNSTNGGVFVNSGVISDFYGRMEDYYTPAQGFVFSSPNMTDLTLGGTVLGNLFFSQPAVSATHAFTSLVDPGTFASNTFTFASAQTSANDTIYTLARFAPQLGAGCDLDVPMAFPLLLPMTVSVTNSTNVTCAGLSNGTIDVSITDGVSPYTVTWSSTSNTVTQTITGTTATATGLPAGVYSILATDDNGLTATYTGVSITEPAAPTIILSDLTTPGTSPCEGISDFYVATSGFASYTWGFGNAGDGTVLSQNAENVTVNWNVTGFVQIYVTGTDANGCTASAVLGRGVLGRSTITAPTLTCWNVPNTFTLNTPSGFGANPIAWATSGGSTIFSPSSPSTFISLFSNGTNTVSCTYTNFNNCIYTTVVTVTNVLLNPSVGVANSILSCGNPVASLSATGVSGVTYLWSNGATTDNTTVSVAGVQTVTVTDANGCSASQSSAPITANQAPPTVTFTPSTGVLTCASTSVVVTATGAATYIWSDGPSANIRTFSSPAIYTVTAVGGNSCTATSTYSVTGATSTLVDVVATPVNESCPSVGFGSVIVDVTGGVPPFTLATSASTVTGVASAALPYEMVPLPIGSYIVTVTDAAGCTLTSNAATINPAVPLFASTTHADPICPSGSSTGSVTLTFGGGGADYFITLTNGTVTQNASATSVGAIVFSNLPSGNYTYTIQDYNACTLNGTVTLTEPIVPTVSLSATSGVLNCTNTSFVVTATGADTYTWSGGVSAGNTVTFSSAGTYNVTGTNTVSGCKAIASVNVTSNTAALPITFANVSPRLWCNPTQTTITMTAPITGADYAWSGISFSSATNTRIVTATSAGIYRVTVTNQANGCTSTAQGNVLPQQFPVPSVSTIPAACNNGQANITATLGLTPYTFDWGGGVTVTSRTGLSAGAYTVTVTDARGCQSVTTTNVALNNLLTVSNTFSNISCFGNSDGTITANPFNGTGPYTYAWDTAPVQTGATATGLSAGTYTVTVTSGTGCTATASQTLTNPPLLSVTAAASNPVICLGGSSDIFRTPNINGVTYTWDNGLGTGGTFNVTPTSTTTYNVTAQNANGCTATSAITIVVNTPAPASISSSSLILNCVTTTLALNASAATSYLWSTGATTTFVNVSTPGTFTLTTTDANGCEATASTTITQDITPPSVSVNPSSADLDCFTPTTTLVATGGISYLWSSGGTNASLLVPAGGILTVVGTGSNGCTASAFSIVTSNFAPPNPFISSSSTTITCANTAITLTSLGTGTNVWSTGATSASITVTTADTYGVTITGVNGCTADASIIITDDIALPTLSISPSSAVLPCTASSVALELVTNTSTYLWNDNSTGIVNIALSPGVYTATVTGLNGCTASASALVTSAPGISVTATASAVSVVSGGAFNVSATPTGGTSPFTFIWSDGSTGQDLVNPLAPLGLNPYIVTVTDVNGCFATGSVDVYVGNLPPVALGASTTNVPNTPVAITITASDPNGNLNLSTLTIITPPAISGAIATAVTATGSIQYLPSLNFVGLDSVQYQICDSNNVCDQAWVFFRFTTPAAYDISLNTNEDQVLNISLWGATNDPGNINWAIVDLTPSVSGIQNAFISANGAFVHLTAPQDTIIEFTPILNFNGVVTMTYTLWSIFPVQESNIATITITVTPVNDAPVANNDGGTVLEDFGASGDVSSNDSDVDIATNGDVLTYTFGTASSGSISGLSDGTWTYASAPDFNGTVTIPYTVCDNGSPVLCDVAFLRLTVTPVDDAPVFTGAFTTVCGDGVASSTLTFSDIDGPASSTWTVVAGNVGLAIQPTSGLYSYTPTAGYNGLDSFSVEVCNGGLCDTSWVVFNVSSPRLTLDTVINVSCFGLSDGSISVTPSGGDGNYSYNWGASYTAQNLVSHGAGSYTVTLTDGLGCENVLNATISEPTALTLTATVDTNVSCFGGINGQASATVTGGTPTYTYLWSDGETLAINTGLSAGVHDITITDGNGCTATTGVTITEPTALTATPGAGIILCSGGITDVTFTNAGGTSPYIVAPTPTGLVAGTYTFTVTDNNGCSTTTSVTITEPTALTATAVAGNILCNGGTADVTITNAGGTAPYTVAGTTTGLVAGTYTFTVTDNNGCSTTTSITITQPTALSATSAAGVILCNGGTTDVTVTPAGGTAPYTTTGVTTNLVAGSYTFTVTDNNGCSTTTSITITQPTALSATSVAGAILCNGGTTDVTITNTGGTPSYTVAPVTTGLIAGTHTFTVTDNNGCSTTTSVTITEPTALTVTSAAGTITCAGGTTDVTITNAGGTAPYTTTGVTTNLIAGSYTFTVTDNNGCSTTTSITITEPTVLSATSAVVSTILCNGGTTDVTVTPAGGTGPYTTTGVTTNLVAGAYTFTVTDNNGCSTTTSITITQPTALSATSVAGVILCNGGTTDVTVTPAGGTAPHTVTGVTTNLVAGSYTFTVTDNYGCSTTTSITITQPTALSATSVAGAILCNGGTTDVTVTSAGGTAPYSTNGVTTNLVAGSYTFTVTDNNGCSTTTSVTITEPTALTVTSVAGTITCNGGTTDVTITNAGGTVPYTIAPTPTGLVAGTYTFTVTDNNGCSTTTSVTITEPTALTATAVAGIILCNGGTTDVTVTHAGATAPYTVTGVTNGLVAGTYTFTVTDSNSCSTTTSVTITEPTALTVDLTSVSTCGSQNSGTISTTVTGGQSPYTFEWSDLGTAQNRTGLASGNYRVTVTDANGCAAVSSVTRISSIPAPAAPATLSTQTCLGDVATLRAYSTQADTFKWYVLVGSPATPSLLRTNFTLGSTGDSLQIGLPTTNTAGNYTYLVNVTRGACASSFSIVGLSVLSRDVASPNQSTTICAGGTAELTATPINGTVRWYDASGTLLSTGRSFTTPALSTTTTYSYSNQPTGAPCPSELTQFVVNVIPNTLEFNSVTGATVCEGTPITISAVTNSPASITWSGPANFRSTSASTLVTSTATTIRQGFYFVTATNANGCQAVSSTFVQVNSGVANPGLVASAQCIGSPIVLVGDAQAGATYQWQTPGRGNFAVTSPDTVFTNATAADNGSYALVVTAGSCAPVTFTITVNLRQRPVAPTVTASPASVCLGGTVQLDAVGVNVNNFIWTLPDGTARTGFGLIINAASRVDSGTYAVVYRDFTNCISDTARVNLDVQSRPILDVADVSSNTPICSGDTLRLTAAPGTIPAGGSMTWTSPLGEVYTGALVEIPNATLARYRGIWSAVLSTGLGCESVPVSVDVDIRSQPSPTAFDATQTGYCVGDSISLVGNTVQGATYYWSGPNGFSQVGSNTTVSIQNVTSANSGVYSLVIGFGTCRSNPFTRQVAVTGRALVSIDGADTLVAFTGSRFFMRATGAAIYEWTPQTRLDDPYRALVQVNTATTDTIVYVVRGSNLSGCSSFDTVVVQIQQAPVGPAVDQAPTEIITPNGDLQNDTWVVQNIENLRDYTVYIYDRRGILVYETKNYDNTNGWNATYEGTDLPEGTYWFIIRTPAREYKGAITVIR